MRIKTASIDAADLFKAVVMKDEEKSEKKGEDVFYLGIEPSGLSLKKTVEDKEVWDKYIFKNTLDDSMLVRHFEKILGDKKMKKESIFKVNGLDATNQIIHLTFKYTVKGQWKKRTFDVDENGKRIKGTSHEVEAIATAKGGKSKELRQNLYDNGFTVDGIHYVRWTRPGSSARTGKCLFVNEELLNSMRKYSDCGVKLSGYGKDHKQPAQIDLASFEAYSSLLLSSIIGTIEIKPENILVIDDYESVFEDEVFITSKNKDNKLITEKKKTKIKNSIWDGQSLIDVSLMGDYAEHGMVLLRNKMFKSCCFNANIQQWFKDNGITDVKNLKRKFKTTAKKIEDIKLITTPSSIKYMKFGSRNDWYKEWLKQIDTTFGVVKYEKPTKHDGGESVLTHYQLINTLQLTDEDIEVLIEESKKYITTLCTDPEAMKKFCKYYCKDTKDNFKMTTKMSILTALLDLNSEFHKTAYYGKLAKVVVENVRDGIKKGKLFVNGNYSTLCGNPIEMLQYTIGQFKGKSQIGQGKIYSTRFDAGKTILACRSPHICMGNIYLPENTVNEDIKKYLNLTREIVCINSINENTLQKLSGCDFDSDTALLTDNEVLIKAASKNYDKFLVPTSDVEAKKLNEDYTPENLANLDYRTSINLIGEIVNYSQILNSLYWDLLSKEEKPSDEELESIYKDICTLSVMSGIEIDKAKKDFGDLNQRVELDTIKGKYNLDAKPDFFDYLTKKNKHRKEDQVYKTYNTSMDKLYNAIKNVKFPKIVTKGLPLKSIINKVNYQSAHVNEAMVTELFNACERRMKANYEMKNMTAEEKVEANIHAYDILFEEVKNIDGIKGIGKSTIRAVFDKLERGNSAIGDYMFTALLNCNCKKVIEILAK